MSCLVNYRQIGHFTFDVCRW